MTENNVVHLENYKELPEDVKKLLEELESKLDKGDNDYLILNNKR